MRPGRPGGRVVRCGVGGGRCPASVGRGTSGAAWVGCVVRRVSAEVRRARRGWGALSGECRQRYVGCGWVGCVVRRVSAEVRRARRGWVRCPASVGRGTSGAGGWVRCPASVGRGTSGAAGWVRCPASVGRRTSGLGGRGRGSVRRGWVRCPASVGRGTSVRVGGCVVRRVSAEVRRARLGGCVVRRVSAEVRRARRGWGALSGECRQTYAARGQAGRVRPRRCRRSGRLRSPRLLRRLPPR